MTSNNTISRRRSWVLSGAIVLLATLSIVRLFFLQVVSGSEYRDEAEGQYVRSASDSFDRGTIYFKTKDDTLISGATVASGFKVIMNPKLLVDDASAYTKLAPYLSISRDEFMDLAGKQTTYREIAWKLDASKAASIDDLELPGISTVRYKWRTYPGGTLASHALGFVGYKGDTLTGRYGVEQYYNEALSRSEHALYVNFFAELFTKLKDTGEKGEAEGDLVLTIDPVVESQFEKALTAVRTKWSSDAAGGLIMDPKTGAIIALSNVPSFDPNTYEDVNDISIFPDTLVERVYEMGSVIKPIVMASALDAGVVTPETSYNDTGSIIVEKREIFNFDKKGRGIATMQDVLGESLNTGMVFVEQKLGKERMRNYLYGFGFNEKTGIDLPNEGRNLVSNLESPREIEYATASFGQGIAITPITAVRAFAALANGGYLVTPHIAEGVIPDNVLKDETYFEYPEGEHPITQATSETITNMLVKNIDEYYNDGSLKLTHYSIAAKTGTAQIPDKVNGGYYDDKHLHTFFGYFPAYNPRFLIFMYNFDPKGVKYSSQTLLPPFIDQAKFLISYYNVAPDR